MPPVIPAGPLRIVTFNTLPFAYQSVATWITANGHEHVAVVTTPGPKARRSEAYREIVALAPPAQDVIVTTQPKRLLAHLRALEPDIILSYTFPYRLPMVLLEIPRYGSVNLHPTLLPAYRGPNPLRPIYDGAPLFGATVHRMDAQFDTGPILGQYSIPVPENLTHEMVGKSLFQVSAAALNLGMAAFFAGEPGRTQDESQASYAAPFGPEDELLAWDIPAQLLIRRIIAIQIFGHAARVPLDGTEWVIRQATQVAHTTTHAPGTVLERTDTHWLVAVADGVVSVLLTPRSV